MEIRIRPEMDQIFQGRLGYIQGIKRAEGFIPVFYYLPRLYEDVRLMNPLPKPVEIWCPSTVIDVKANLKGAWIGPEVSVSRDIYGQYFLIGRLWW